MAASVVQSKPILSAPGSAPSATFDSPVTAGNAIVVTVAYFSEGSSSAGGSTEITVTDNRSDTFTTRSLANTTPNRNRAAVCEALNVTGGTTTVTVTSTGPGNQYIGAVAHEVAGLASSAAFDVGAINQDTGTTFTTGTTATTAQADEIAFAVFASESSGVMQTPSGYTNTYTEPSASTTVACSHNYKVLSATGTQSAGWTAGSATQHGGAIATFKAGAGGGPPPTVEDSPLGTRRNRPGRGPYSLGRYFRQRVDAFTSLVGSVFSGSISETASASDSVSATVVHAVTIAESASAADSFAATLAAVATMAETGALTDSLNAALAATAAISETGSATFTPTTGAAISAAIVETAAAADSIASVLNAAAALAESGNASDSYSAIASLVAALAESGNATDTVSWGGAVYSVDLVEAANATDTLTAAVNALAALAETGGATDIVAALATLQATLAEAGSALDALTVSGVYGVSVSETGNITFTVSVDSGILPGTPSRSVTVRAANRNITVRAANRTVTVH